jgi:hypothetical protein
MAKRIIVIGVIITLIIGGAALLTATAPVAAENSATAAVHIKYTWLHSDAHGTQQTTVRSLGTLIAPNVILTHNHYGRSLGRQPSDMLTLSNEAGQVWKWKAVEALLIVINAGTAVIWLPADVALPTATLASAAEVRQLKVGNTLSVSCWDKSRLHLTQHDFRIIQINQSIIRLADPDRLIRPGDSGGGAFLNNKLVGNVWSINLDSNLQSSGSFNVALLPSQVRSYVR